VALAAGAVLLAATVALAGAASPAARGTLLVFGLAIIAWTVLRLPDTPVALTAALALVLTSIAPQQSLFDTLGNSLIWLLIAAFVIASALCRSGVAERLAVAAVRRAGTARSLFHSLCLVIFATAFVVPSTSGRAALLLPVFLALAAVLDSARLKRALALLFPTIVLLSAAASLIGAGAHVVAADFMQQASGARIDFLRWFALGAPFALVTSLAATEIILRAFLTSAERSQRLDLRTLPSQSGESRQQSAVLSIVLATVAGWMTAPWHGQDVATVALVGALAVTASPLTGLSFKQALKDVEWNLLLFLAATLLLGETLVASGAADALIGARLDAMLSWDTGARLVVVAIACAVALLSHLLIVSRTARATVLIPTLALPLAGAGLDPAALVFLVTMASGFCQTLAVSAKPVTLFARLDAAYFTDRDLLRLALLLLPMMLVALLLFASYVWPALGLPLMSAAGISSRG
jgi:anion transporter